jgi:hypothetical protein
MGEERILAVLVQSVDGVAAALIRRAGEPLGRLRAQAAPHRRTNLQRQGTQVGEEIVRLARQRRFHGYLWFPGRRRARDGDAQIG